MTMDSNSNLSQDPKKGIAVDIVLIPSDEVANLAIEASNSISKTRDGKIHLNRQDSLPHISLAMGCIKENNVERIDKTLSDITEGFSPIPMIISGIQIEGIPTKEKVSCLKIENSHAIQLLHETIMKRMSQYLTFDVSLDMIFLSPNEIFEECTLNWIRNFKKESSFEKFSPHITLGIGELKGENIDTTFPMEFTATQLALCNLGNYCTCRKVISTYNLGKNNDK
jgi:2'-5' RNA ligase